MNEFTICYGAFRSWKVPLFIRLGDKRSMGASREELDAQEERLNNLSNSQISNYLTFFEVLNLLRLKGSVKLELMDDLFAYRFFIAVRNPVIYRRKLKYGNFANIRQLHDEWVAYRVERNLKIYGVQCYE